MAEAFSVALKKDLTEVKDALPLRFNIPRCVQNYVAFLNDNSQLKDYSKKYGADGIAQIKMAILKTAYLDLDALNNEVYLIPYSEKIQIMPSYKGSIKTAKRYSTRPIKDIYCKLVREGDEYSEEIVNGQQVVNFKAIPFSNAKIIGAFAVCVFEDGGFLVESMSVAEIENVRASSKSKNSVPWTKHYGEMAKKTILHRLCKRIDISFDNPKQKEYFEEDMKIETDPKIISEMEIEQNANKEEFIIDET